MKKLIILSVFIGLFSACTKDQLLEEIDTSRNNGKILSKVQYWNNNTKTATTTTELIFAGNDIKEVKLYKTDGTIWYTYNKIETSNGRVSKIEGTLAPNNTAVTWEFKYDATGKIIESKKAEGPNSKTYYFTYDANGRVASSINDDASLEYIYEGSAKNPSSIKEFNNYTFSTSTIQYKYDSKKNPYTNAPFFLFYMNNGEFFENNVTEVIRPGLTIKYNYEYNQADFPLKKRDADTGGGLNFVYQ